MENKDFSNINLLDVGLSTAWSFYNQFLAKKIKTVGQVLDEETMKDVFESLRTLKARDELNGFIDFIKFRFLNQTLTTDIYLEKPATVLEEINLHEYPEFLSRMGFLEEDSLEIGLLYKNYVRNHPDEKQNATILDIFQYRLEHQLIHSQETEFKIRLFLDSHQKSNDKTRSLEFLRQEIMELEKKKAKLEKSIMQIERKLESLETIYQSSGGEKK